MDRSVDCLIVGQGIAGTILSYKLVQKGYTVKVIDDGHITSSSTKAAGIINPITGRSYVKSWRIDELIPAAKATYNDLEELLGGKYFHDHNIVRVLSSIFEENKWSGRLLDDSYTKYIVDEYDHSKIREYFNDIVSTAVIKGARVSLRSLIRDYRNWLEEEDMLIRAKFSPKKMRLEARVMYYEDLEVGNLIFADGVQSIDNPYFPDLPFQHNKGEVLLVRISNYEVKDIVKHGIFICPFEDDLYWVGSGYDKSFEDAEPTVAGKLKLKDQLSTVLKSDYKIVKHIAGIRPSVKGRKPLLGRSLKHHSIYLFGGLGTKGSSLAPYWADHLIQFIQGRVELDAEVDFTRF